MPARIETEGPQASEDRSFGWRMRASDRARQEWDRLAPGQREAIDDAIRRGERAPGHEVLAVWRSRSAVGAETVVEFVALLLCVVGVGASITHVVPMLVWQAAIAASALVGAGLYVLVRRPRWRRTRRANALDDRGSGPQPLS